MLEIITWFKQVPQYRNFQLLLATILLSISWVALFSIHYVPFDLTDTVIVLAFAGGGFISGVALPAIDSAEDVGSIAVIRYMFWLATGSVLTGIIMTRNPLWLGAGISGGIIGFAISMGSRWVSSQNNTTHIIILWNMFLVFWIIGLAGLAVSGLRGGTPALAGLVVSFAVLVSQHQTFADEVGVNNGS